MGINYFYFVEVLAISGIFSIYHYFCLRQNVKHQVNRWIILSSLAFSLLLPLINIPVTMDSQFVMPYNTERTIVTNNNPGESETVATTGIFHQSIDFTGILSLALVFISLLMFAKLMFSLWAITGKIRGQQAQPLKHCRVIYDNSIEQPFSFFKWVFIPESLQKDSDLLPAILAHEATHARQWHSIDKLLTQLVKTVLWWNPFFYYLQRALLLTHEYEADAVAAKQTGTKQYTTALVGHLFPGIASSIVH